MNPELTPSPTGPSSAENAKSGHPYPETVIPTELHSEKENEFEGLSDINPPKHYTSEQDRIQTDKHKANQQYIY